MENDHPDRAAAAFPGNAPAVGASRSASSACLLAGFFLLVVFSCWFCGKIDGGLPEPAVHDEFGYLLGGELYSQGRLSMPRHPVWQAFESFHILQTPVYAPKHPPGQALFLAAGFLLGHPIYGVWLSVGLLATALVWMTLPFGRPGMSYALGACAALWFGGVTYWAQSYWGGAVTALGAVLVWGGLIRFLRASSLIPAFAMGGGAALLFLSRPFEGGLACVIPAFLLVARFVENIRRRGDWSFAKPMLIGGIPLMAAVMFQGAVNKSVTGSWLRLPYQEYNAQYDATPILFFQKKGEYKEFRHPRMEQLDIQLRESEGYFPNPVYREMLRRLGEAGGFYVGFLGTPFLIAAFLLGQSPWVRRAAWGIGVSLLSCMLVYPSMIHYYAALVAPLGILFYHGAGGLLRLLPARRLLPFAAIVAIALLIEAMTRSYGMGLHPDILNARNYRRGLIEKLEHEEGRHLVVVRYTNAAPSIHAEYVYNGADIDSQKIVWARWSEWGENTPLFHHFNGRRLWMLIVGSGTPELRPFEWRE